MWLTSAASSFVLYMVLAKTQRILRIKMVALSLTVLLDI